MPTEGSKDKLSDVTGKPIYLLNPPIKKFLPIYKQYLNPKNAQFNPIVTDLHNIQTLIYDTAKIFQKELLQSTMSVDSKFIYDTLGENKEVSITGHVFCVTR